MAELQKMKSYQQLTRSFLKLVKFAKTKKKIVKTAIPIKTY